MSGTMTFGPITLTDLVRYQGASGDFNTIHHDGVAAAARGGRVVSPGMYQAGLITTWISHHLPDVEVRRLSTRFQAPVHLGDTLTVTGERTGDRVAIICRIGDGVVAASAVVELAS